LDVNVAPVVVPGPGSSVGTSVRLKSGRSAVRPRPWPQIASPHPYGWGLFSCRSERWLWASRACCVAGLGCPPSQMLSGTGWRSAVLAAPEYVANREVAAGPRGGSGRGNVGVEPFVRWVCGESFGGRRLIAFRAVGAVWCGWAGDAWGGSAQGGWAGCWLLVQVGRDLACGNQGDAVSDLAVTVWLRARRTRITSIVFAGVRHSPGSSVRAAAQYR
jgi:hypothetical protein